MKSTLPSLEWLKYLNGPRCNNGTCATGTTTSVPRSLRLTGSTRRYAPPRQEDLRNAGRNATSAYEFDPLHHELPRKPNPSLTSSDEPEARD